MTGLESKPAVITMADRIVWYMSEKGKPLSLAHISNNAGPGDVGDPRRFAAGGKVSEVINELRADGIVTLDATGRTWWYALDPNVQTILENGRKLGVLPTVEGLRTLVDPLHRVALNVEGNPA